MRYHLSNEMISENRGNAGTQSKIRRMEFFFLSHWLTVRNRRFSGFTGRSGNLAT